MHGTQPSTQIDRDAAQEQAAEITRRLLLELGAAQAINAVAPEAHLERDLGLGSLERVELILRIGQAFGVPLPERMAAEANTLGDLIEAALAATAAGDKLQGRQAEIFSADLAHVRRHPLDEGAADSPDPVRALGLESAETLNEVLERHAKSAPRRPQVYLREDPATGSEHAEPHLITYGDIHENALAVARSLAHLGIGPQQTVAIMLPTCREFFFSFYGVLLTGAIPVPIYPPFRADRIEEYAARQAAILRNAEARALITFRQAELVARLLKPKVPSLAHVATAQKLIDGARQNAQAGVPVPHKAKGDDIAFIQYTSGSTGEPKGVALTHVNLLANMRAIREAVDFRPGDVGVSWLPLYHDMGLIGAWLTLLYGGLPVAVMSPLAFLTRPERWLWAFHHHRGSVTAAPNFAFELCVRKIADRDIEGLDLSSMRAALNGAEPIHPETLDRFTERFAPYGFHREAMLPVYGLAEASLAVTVPPLGRGPLVDRVDRHTFQCKGHAVPAAEGDTSLAFVSCGRPVPRHEVRIADQHGRELPDRVEGQLWFRGPSATRGYYRNPEATRAILRGDGWVDSGDRAYRAAGEIFITGRVKDIIIKAGRNLYPHEVEEVAGRATGVRKGCIVAFGAPDKKSGTERLVVVAETREKAPDEKTVAAVRAEVTARVAEGLGLPPDVVELIPPGAIPKTSSGKLRRNETKLRFLAGKLHERRVPALVQMARLGAAGSVKMTVGGARRVLELLYGIWGYIAFVGFLLPTWLLAYLAPTRVTACRVTQIGTRLFFRLAGIPIRVRGREQLNGNLPCVFVANHASFLDVVLHLALFKFLYRFVSKLEVASWPFIGTFLRVRNDFAFNRDDRNARLAQAEALEGALRDGESLLIFPEGTFIPAPGLRAFQLGAFKAAVATGRPVCPIAVRGLREIFRDETNILRPGSITVTICPPIWPDTRPGVSPWSEILRLRDASREAIAAHCGEPVL